MLCYGQPFLQGRPTRFMNTQWWTRLVGEGGKRGIGRVSGLIQSYPRISAPGTTRFYSAVEHCACATTQCPAYRSSVRLLSTMTSQATVGSTARVLSCQMRWCRLISKARKQGKVWTHAQFRSVWLACSWELLDHIWKRVMFKIQDLQCPAPQKQGHLHKCGLSCSRIKNILSQIHATQTLRTSRSIPLRCSRRRSSLSIYVFIYLH